MAARFINGPPNSAQIPLSRPVPTKIEPTLGAKPLARSTARPGTFWDAIVTMKSGRPRLPSVASETIGGVKVGCGQLCAKAPGGSLVTKTTVAIVTTSAIGTA